MPLKRTPPATTLQVTETDTYHSSAPATDTENEEAYITNRNRPRKRQHDDELAVFMTEMKNSIQTLTKQQDVIQESIANIQKQNNDIITSMDFISKQYEDMKNNLAKIESDRRSSLAYIQNLEQKLESLKRTQRQASIEIRNIPIQIQFNLNSKIIYST
jgi:chromosome segregation ATPase